MVGNNFRKQKSSSEIQKQEAKKIKRHKSDVERLEEFRRSLLGLNEVQEVTKNENPTNDSFDIDWEAVEAEALKNLSQSSKNNQQKPAGTEDYEDLILAIPNDLLAGENVNNEPVVSKMKLENDMVAPTTSGAPKLSPKIDAIFPKKRVYEISSKSSELPKQSVASKEEIEQKRQEALKRREEALKKFKSEQIKSPPKIYSIEVSAETQEEIRQRIEKNRQDALKRLQENNIKIPNKTETSKLNEIPKDKKIPQEPRNNPSTSSSSTKFESQEEIKKRIEKNRQEALRRLQQNKVHNVNKNDKILIEKPSTSTSVQNVETEEEIKRRIEKNRQDALLKLKQKGLIPSVIESSLIDLNMKASSTISKPSPLMQQNTREISKNFSETTKDETRKENASNYQASSNNQASSSTITSSSSTLSEETKRKIEEKRLEAIKRREMWLKNQNKGSN